MRYKYFLVCFGCSSEDSSFGPLHTLNLSNISAKLKLFFCPLSRLFFFFRVYLELKIQVILEEQHLV